MGNPLLAGRTITSADIEDRTFVAVVTEDFALTYWESPAPALGKRISLFSGDPASSSWREIVGVVGNVHDDGMSQAAVPIVFWPQVVSNWWAGELFTSRSMAYAVRTVVGD